MRFPGWYPVAICYDPEEGVFPDSCYWDGSSWIGGDRMIAFRDVCCATEDEALDDAYEHDYEDSSEGWIPAYEDGN